MLRGEECRMRERTVLRRANNRPLCPLQGAACHLLRQVVEHGVEPLVSLQILHVIVVVASPVHVGEDLVGVAAAL